MLRGRRLDPGRFRSWAAAVALAFAAAWPFPLAVIAALGGLAVRCRTRTLRAAVAWAFVLAPLLVVSIGDPFAWQVVAVWMTATGIAAWPARSVSGPAWLLVLATLATLMVYEQVANARTFAPADDLTSNASRLIAPFTGLQRLPADSRPGQPWYRSWEVSAVPDAAVHLDLEVRAVEWQGTVGWYLRDVTVTPLGDGGERFTPSAPEGRAWRVWSDGVPLGGRTFRLSGEWHLPSEGSDCGPLSLRVDVRPWLRACPLAEAEHGAYRPFVVEWQVPLGVVDQRMRWHVGGEGSWQSVTLRGMVVEEVIAGEVVPLRGMVPADVTLEVRVSDGANGATVASTGVNLQEAWSTLRVSVPLAAGATGTMLATVRAPAGTPIELRSLSVRADDGVRVRALRRPERSRAWYGDPNIAAHAIIGLMFAGMARARRGRGLVAVLVIGLLALALTGSRSGFLLGLAGGVFALAGGEHRRLPRALLLALVLAAVAGAALALDARVAAVHQDGNAVARVDIWSAAVRSISEQPWSGWGTGRSSGALRKWLPDPEAVVAHAHNFWLEMGVRFGGPGIVASIWVAVVLVVWAWRVGRWRVVVPTLCILATNLVDASLLTTYVWAGLAWLLIDHRDTRTNPSSSSFFSHGLSSSRSLPSAVATPSSVAPPASTSSRRCPGAP
jgi:hypothetical protein